MPRAAETAADSADSSAGSSLKFSPLAALAADVALAAAGGGVPDALEDGAMQLLASLGGGGDGGMDAVVASTLDLTLPTALNHPPTHPT